MNNDRKPGRKRASLEELSKPDQKVGLSFVELGYQLGISKGEFAIVALLFCLRGSREPWKDAGDWLMNVNNPYIVFCKMLQHARDPNKYITAESAARAVTRTQGQLGLDLFWDFLRYTAWGQDADQWKKQGSVPVEIADLRRVYQAWKATKDHRTEAGKATARRVRKKV
jgi:hypothetical protein